MMRRSTGLDANEARRQTIRVNAMNLKDRLRDIEIDSRNRLHDLAPPTTSMAVVALVEEPSTASTADVPSHSRRWSGGSLCGISQKDGFASAFMDCPVIDTRASA
jgi:hypothetical protein